MPAAPPGGLAFALMGDMPYFEAEVPRLDRLIDDLNEQDLAFVVHVGDITSGRGPCTDAWFEARRQQFARLRHAFVLLPGDNDWTDCHRSGFDPLERLARWRAAFCISKNNFPLKIERQAGAHCEHVRWQAGGLLFVALNVQGSNDNLGRTPAMDREQAARQRAVLAWIDASAALFRERKLEHLLLLMQANPFLEPRRGANAYAALLAKIVALAQAHPGRVVLVHGDTHRYRDDAPLPGLRRIEVFGSPLLNWLLARETPGGLQVAPAVGR